MLNGDEFTDPPISKEPVTGSVIGSARVNGVDPDNPYLEVLDVLHPELMEPAWAFYRERFRDISKHSVQCHIMSRPEFETMMRDPRIQKYVYTDGVMCGLATLTRHLETVPLLSLPYFEHHWPDAYHDYRIFYIPFLASTPPRKSTPTVVFDTILERMYREVAEAGGIVGLDVSRRTLEKRQLPQRILSRLQLLTKGQTYMRQPDEQSYVFYEFPKVGGAQ